MKANEIKLLIIMAFSVILLTSCGGKIVQEKQTVNEMNPINELLYSKNDFNLSGVKLNSPGKIISDSENLFICDTGNDRIIKCDFNGNNVLIIGELGSMDGEFSSPECIALNTEKICVYDRENKRIQVLDKKGNFISKFEIKDVFSSVANIIDIEIDKDNNIYFSLISYGKHLKEAGLYVLTPDNNCKLIKSYFVGNLYCAPDSDEIFYVSQFELKNENEWQTGYSELGTIKECVYETKNAFSSMFSSVDITGNEKSYLIFDDATQSIYEFNETGICQKQVFSEDVQNEFQYTGFCAGPNESLYLSDRANNKIYVLMPLE